MCAQPTQRNRSISIKTPLGADKLVLQRFSYSDALNRPFELTADLLSSDQSITFDRIVGHPITITMDLANGDKRYFHGFVSDFMQKGREVGTAVYKATIVPWLTHLSNVSDCQIFQYETIPDIVTKVIKKAGFTDIIMDLAETYSPLEFCVQYRESNRDFVSRLMEKAGICYYFKHEESRHMLVLTDRVSKHTPYSDYNTVIYREAEATGSKIEAISGWTVSKRAWTVRFAQTDFDFKRPQTDLKVVAPMSRPHGLADFEQFDFPGGYIETSEGERLAKARIEAIQSQYEIVSGQASCRGLATGCTFKLKDHPRVDQNREYLLTSVNLHFDAGGFSSGGGGVFDENVETFSCDFAAMPTTQQFRPARLIRKPLIMGPQTAIVTGPAGEEIHVDEYGRVKVHFHWDRYSKYNEDSSCWIRVSQAWAGRGWGAMHIPRIGQEVIVEFLEGDPDRPIITGCVYNGIEKPPYDLPANKNISTIKSESTKGGNGFNEVKMDDTKGKELLYIQAEKDNEIRVKHDHVEWIGNESHLIVKKDQFEQVEGSKHLRVKNDQNEQVEGSVSLKTGADLQQKIGGKHALEVSQQIHLKAGATIVIEAGTSITLKAGGAFITVGPAGVAISGNPVLINSGGAAGSGSGAVPEAAKTPREPGKRPTDSAEQAAPSPAAGALTQAAKDGAPFCEQCEGASRA